MNSCQQAEVVNCIHQSVGIIATTLAISKAYSRELSSYRHTFTGFHSQRTSVRRPQHRCVLFTRAMKARPRVHGPWKKHNNTTQHNTTSAVVAALLLATTSNMTVWFSWRTLATVSHLSGSAVDEKPMKAGVKWRHYSIRPQLYSIRRWTHSNRQVLWRINFTDAVFHPMFHGKLMLNFILHSKFGSHIVI